MLVTRGPRRPDAHPPLPAGRAAPNLPVAESKAEEETGSTPNAATAPALPPRLSGRLSELDIGQAQRADPDFQALITLLADGQPPASQVVADRLHTVAANFVWNGLALYRRTEDGQTVAGPTVLKIVVPASLRAVVLQECHDSAMAGHLGEDRTTWRVRSLYWWPSVVKDCEQWVKSCRECSQRKKPKGPQFAELASIPTGGTFGRMGMDFVGPLPTTRHGNKWLLVCTLYAERWAFAFPLPSSEADTVAQVLVDRVFSLIGAINELLTDRGPQFQSKLIRELCDLLKINKIATSAYHPQTDGLVERFNQTLINMLSKFTNEKQDDWDVFVPLVTFAYNTTPQKSTGESPYFLMFGRDPVWPSRFPSEARYSLAPQFKTAAAFRSQLATRLSEAREAARRSIEAAQSKQRTLYNRSHQPHPFQLYDRVWLHTPRVAAGLKPKLARLWTGPFRIDGLTDTLARIRNIASGVLLKQRVHVSRLKPCYEDCAIRPRNGDAPVIAPAAPPFDPELEDDGAFENSTALTEEPVGE